MLRGHAQNIGERLQADVAAFMKLPAVAFDPCHMVTGRASSLSLVRYRTNDYSVPTAHAPQEVVIKGHVERVEIICHGERIAVHPRSYWFDSDICREVCINRMQMPILNS